LAGRNRERDPALFEAAAVDDFVAQALTLDDGGRVARQAEGRLAVIGGAVNDLEAHRHSPV
jgi:hypothetical protein